VAPCYPLLNHASPGLCAGRKEAHRAAARPPSFPACCSEPAFLCKAALGLQDRTVKLWDLSCGQMWAVFAEHTREVNDVVFCSNGHYLVSASAANAVWWVKRGEVLVWKAPP